MKRFAFLIFAMFFMLSSGVNAQDRYKYVYSSTTAEAIDELNYLVPDYEERKQVLLKIKDLEKQGKVIISNKQYIIIQERIDSFSSLTDPNKKREAAVYEKMVKERYVEVRSLIQK